MRLYVSDVDGTLTKKSAYPTEKTKEILGELLKKGCNFTIATGRSLGSAVLVKELLDLNLPIICFNGAFAFDTEKDEVVSSYPIKREVAEQVLDIFEKINLPYRFCMFNEERQQVVSYRTFKPRLEITKSKNKKTGFPYEEVFVEDEIRSHSKEGEILYIGHSCEKEKLILLEKDLKNVKGISYAIHSDPYNADNWFIDIYSDKAGKDVGAYDIKNLIGADELVTFGDNFNDYPLLKNADRSYTVAKADEEIKKIVTAVLPDNEDCVAEFVKMDFDGEK